MVDMPDLFASVSFLSMVRREGNMSRELAFLRYRDKKTVKI